MSKHTLSSLSLVACLAFVVFVVAFALLMIVGDYSVLGSFFMAALVAFAASIVLLLGLGSPAQPYQQAATAARMPAADVGATAGADVGSSDQGSDEATAAAAEAEAKASEEAAKQAAEAEAAAAAKAAADEAAAKAAADEAAAAKAAEEEAAAAKAEQDAAAAKAAEQEAAAAKAAAEQEAARSREEEAARKAAEEREAARVAAEEAKAAREAVASEPAPVAAPASADRGEDYDGDGVLEGTNEGSRPAGLDAPRDGKADDLKQIKGIGPKLEKLCNSLGFWHFDQVAAWTSDEVAWVDANLTGFKGRVSRDEWVNQAKTLAAGGETEFSKRVEDGDVY